MIIQHAILHILDTNTGNLIASQGEMPVTDIGVHDYIEKLVNKIYAGDVKTGTITGNDYLQTILAEKNFPKMTTELAMKLFEVVTGSDNIQAGDLLSFQATTDDGPIFGMIKLNFSPRYAHAVAYVSEKMVNNLVLNQAVLPAATQTVDEAILINMTTSKYHLIEKSILLMAIKWHTFQRNFWTSYRMFQLKKICKLLNEQSKTLLKSMMICRSMKHLLQHRQQFMKR